MEKITLYCAKSSWVSREYPGVAYELMVRDASKKATPSNLSFIRNGGKKIVVNNEFHSVKIIDSREGTSFYFYVGFKIDKNLGLLQIKGVEISNILPQATMINGNIIGNFKFVQSGSHTRLRAIGNQLVGSCKYWLDEYLAYDLFSLDEREGIHDLLQGSEKDIELASIMIESKKGEFYKKSF